MASPIKNPSVITTAETILVAVLIVGGIVGIVSNIWSIRANRKALASETELEKRIEKLEHK